MRNRLLILGKYGCLRKSNLNSLTQDVCFLMALPGLLKVQGIDASPAQVTALEGFEVI